MKFNPGIQRDKTMADNYIPNDATQNYRFCRLKLVVEMLEHSTESKTKVVKPTNKKTLS